MAEQFRFCSDQLVGFLLAKFSDMVCRSWLVWGAGERQRDDDLFGKFLRSCDQDHVEQGDCRERDELDERVDGCNGT